MAETSVFYLALSLAPFLGTWINTGISVRNRKDPVALIVSLGLLPSSLTFLILKR